MSSEVIILLLCLLVWREELQIYSFIAFLSINGNILYTTRSTLLNSLKNLSWTSFPVCNTEPPLSFKLLPDIPVYECPTTNLTDLLMKDVVFFFQSFAITNSAAINILVHTLYAHVPLEYPITGYVHFYMDIFGQLILH